MLKGVTLFYRSINAYKCKSHYETHSMLYVNKKELAQYNEE